jgi:hypothetical protein
MSLISLLIAATLAGAPQATLVLDKVRAVDDPRRYDLRDPVNGDRGVPKTCPLGDRTTVTLTSARNATLEVSRDGSKKTVVVEDVQGLGRATLACGDGDVFYYANPRHGKVYAYSADRLLRGDNPIVWARHVEPFKSLDDAGGVLTEASVASAIQARQNMLLVEWFFRENGDTGFWHEVFDGATGAELGKIGPSDLLVKTNEDDPWWIVFQGGGNDAANYAPQGIYRLSYGLPVDGARPAGEIIAALRSQAPPHRSRAITKLSSNPVINHMIALLSPTRTSPDATIAFCPTVPAERARYWLGDDYDELLGALARNILLAFWAEGHESETGGSPIDAWFRTEIAPKEPMRSLLVRFDPHDDEWVSQYQQALLALGRPTFESLFTKYGTATGAVVRTPARKDAP